MNRELNALWARSMLFGNQKVVSLGTRTKSWMRNKLYGISENFGNMFKCVRLGEQIKTEDLDHSSDSLATRDYTASGYSSKPGDPDPKLDNSNIEEAESSLRESGYLNYEEARALLGRLEYQKGNIEAALHVFEGIDIAAVTPKIKSSLSRRFEQNRRRSHSDSVPSMSLHTISLLLEAVFLKAKSLQGLGRSEEAAYSCKVILDTVESALPEGLPENFTSSDCKLQEILAKVVESLPELWKLVGSLDEAVLSYRRALLYKWNLDTGTRIKIEKEFAIFLLYSGCEASPPNLRSQMDGSFVPRNNLEEAILLLLLLLRRQVIGKISWDPSVIDHLSFALSVSGDLKSLARQLEKLLPSSMGRRERYLTLALCYYAQGNDSVSLNLLRNVLNNQENKDCCAMEFLLASKICGENSISVDEGIDYARKALSKVSDSRCSQMVSLSSCLLGVLLSAKSRTASSDSERIMIQEQALLALEASERAASGDKNPYIAYHLCLEHAEQRKLEKAFYYAKKLIGIEAGTSVRGYILLARVLSAQKRFTDAEAVINMAMEQTEKWDHGELLRTKAKLQIKQDRVRNAIETYTHLLAVLQVQTKSVGAERRLQKSNYDRKLEMETWHDLAKLYMNLSQWHDAEVCLLKSQAINPHSASRWHCAGLLDEAKGLHREALKSFKKALDVDPTHVPSLISTACTLREIGGESLPIVRSFLMDALRIDRNNSSAWYNLGLLNKQDSRASPREAAECFEAAAILEEFTPIEPFRHTFVKY